MLLDPTASATDFHVSSLSGSRCNNRVIIALGGRLSLLAADKAGPIARDDPDGHLRVVRILPCRAGIPSMPVKLLPEKREPYDDFTR